MTGSPKVETCRHEGSTHRWTQLSETTFPHISKFIAEEANPATGQTFRAGFLFDLELADEGFHALGKVIGAEI